MPIEVREIGIRLSVGDEAGAAQDWGDGGAGRGRLSAAERRDIVEECVAAVLAALEDREER